MIIPPQFTTSCFFVLPILKDVSALKSRHNDLFLSGMQKHQHNDRYDFLLHDMNMVRWSSRLQVKNALGAIFILRKGKGVGGWYS